MCVGVCRWVSGWVGRCVWVCGCVGVGVLVWVCVGVTCVCVCWTSYPISIPDN